ncbi:T9SS type A sorting domain-containing protein [Ferruginibacter lapsinanis]|uniref:T9SS type A sorting domain-containing protein n=1 Tax=Ferruginibacter lapsinanis TaxID=563172 RepID=UPI001E3C3005|nr:T9SS type A sorting domain-containing protein [Ferruginibacter lapsinanis]UEG49507.1 T9SS type A sorting domain-containing protein [Ferruginibacter lapsinanis]
MKKPIICLLLVIALFTSECGFGQPKLNSLPSAPSTIYLDFDGQIVNSGVWNSGVSFTCLAATLSESQIIEIFDRVSEDYRPFQINITTDETVFLAAPLEQRIRVIITPTSGWYSLVGGVAYIGSFTWGDDTPCFVFSKNLGNVSKTIAECCSHESGHSLGLLHQSTYDSFCNLSSTLNAGSGEGESAWTPIMGISYNRNMSTWSNGTTPYDCSYLQDNLNTITSYNGFSYREDDFANDLNTDMVTRNYTAINIDGVISAASDKDAFKINLSSAGSFHVAINPYSIGANNEGANLDCKVELYNASKILLRKYDPVATMDVVIDTFLAVGDYYLIVSGTGNANTNNYGSLGAYKIIGFGQIILPVHDVVLIGTQKNGICRLSWSIRSEVPVKKIVVEVSADGISFNSIKTSSLPIDQFDYTPYAANNIYYRTKVLSVDDQTTYSNTVMLRGTNKTGKTFTVSTLVQNNISINATADYLFQLVDISGKILLKGRGVKGLNTLNISKQSAGIYILQLINNNERQTERVVKQ